MKTKALLEPVRSRRPSPDELRNVRSERFIKPFEIETRQLVNGQPGDLVFSGYASTFNDEYEVYGGPANGYGWFEAMANGAFDITLAAKPDLMLLINHTDMPLARTKSGSLRLRTDQTGLWTEADLQRHDPDVQRLLPKMERKDMDEMSFAFRVIRDRWEAHADFPDDPMSLRVIEEVSLHKGDVSIVNYGANPYTAGAKIDIIQAAEMLADASPAELRALLGNDEERAQLVRAARTIIDLGAKRTETADDEEPAKTEAEGDAEAPEGDPLTDDNGVPADEDSEDRAKKAKEDDDDESDDEDGDDDDPDEDHARDDGDEEEDPDEEENSDGDEDDEEENSDDEGDDDEEEDEDKKKRSQRYKDEAKRHLDTVAQARANLDLDPPAAEPEPEPAAELTEDERTALDAARSSADYAEARAALAEAAARQAAASEEAAKADLRPKPEPAPEPRTKEPLPEPARDQDAYNERKAALQTAASRAVRAQAEADKAIAEWTEALRSQPEPVTEEPAEPARVQEAYDEVRTTLQTAAARAERAQAAADAAIIEWVEAQAATPAPKPEGPLRDSAAYEEQRRALAQARVNATASQARAARANADAEVQLAEWRKAVAERQAQADAPPEPQPDPYTPEVYEAHRRALTEAQERTAAALAEADNQIEAWRKRAPEPEPQPEPPKEDLPVPAADDSRGHEVYEATKHRLAEEMARRSGQMTTEELVAAKLAEARREAGEPEPQPEAPKEEILGTDALAALRNSDTYREARHNAAIRSGAVPQGTPVPPAPALPGTPSVADLNELHMRDLLRHPVELDEQAYLEARRALTKK